VKQLDVSVTAWYWDMDGFDVNNPPKSKGGAIDWQMVCTGLKAGELETFSSKFWTILKAEPAFQIPGAHEKWVLPGAATAFDLRRDK
jgi:hypothetical protein